MAVKSSRVVFDVLELVAGAEAPLGAVDVARLLSLPVTTAARALATLEATGHVERRNGSARFVPGKAGQRLAYAFMTQFPVRDLALPYLHQLTLLSGSSSSLFVRLGWFSVRIALIAGTGSIVNMGRIGEARPLTTGAPSLSLLAHLPERELARATERHGADADAMAGRCRRIRAQGYALEPSPMQNGGWDLALPLADRDGRVASAVALEGIAAGPQELRARIDAAAAAVRPLREVLARPTTAVASHYDHVDPDGIVLG